MNTLLRITGISALVSFYRYIYVNQPKLTTLTGIVLILGVGSVHAVEAPRHFEAAVYLGVLFVANAVGTLAAAVGLLRGAKSWGWTLGAVISGLSALAYLVSRLFGLPTTVAPTVADSSFAISASTPLADVWEEPPLRPALPSYSQS